MRRCIAIARIDIASILLRMKLSSNCFLRGYFLRGFANMMFAAQLRLIDFESGTSCARAKDKREVFARDTSRFFKPLYLTIFHINSPPEFTLSQKSCCLSSLGES